VLEYLIGDDNMDKKRTKYLSGVFPYKNVTCRMTEYEDLVVSEHCRKNNISKSLFLNCAALYCVKNNIKIDELLECSMNDSTFDYKEYIKHENEL
jgi:hypothetical protein